MHILVDYNNLVESDRRRGIQYVAERILTAIGAERLGKRQRATLRLYDGWYESSSPSRVAQEVSVDVQNNSPHTVTLIDGTRTKTLIVNVELAYALRSDPSFHLVSTYRSKALQSNISCISPTDGGCTVSPCPLIPMEQFFTSRKCPVIGCAMKPQNLLVRNEQKLIDTMMAADLFSLHLTAEPEAVIVSSDDDLLPAIRMLVQIGTKVIHVLTRPPHPSLASYVSGLNSVSYTQLQLLRSP